MKNCILYFFLFLNVTGFSQQWQWGKNSTRINALGFEHLVTDGIGNCYETFAFQTTITIDSVTINGRSGDHDVGLFKCNSGGKVLWGKSFGGNYNDFPNALSKDVFGNIYLGGQFQSDSIKFDSIVLKKDSLDACNAFLTKIDSGGNVIWARSFGGGPVENVQSIVSDRYGYIYVTGVFSNTISLGNVLITTGERDIFVTKMDQTGNVIWAKRLGSYETEIPWALALDNTGNLYMAGSFEDSLLVVGSDSLINAGYNSDIVLTKFDPAGNIVWSKRQGGDHQDVPTDIEINENGEVYMSGAFLSSSITFDGTTLNNPYPAEAWSGFVSKFSPGGGVLWAKTNQGSGAFPTSMALDINGDLYVTGFSYGQVIFGNDTLKKMMDPPPFFRLFIVKYDGSGNPILAKGGSCGDARLSNVASDLLGNIFVTGSFNCDTLHLGGIKMVINSDNSYYNTYNMFIAKLGWQTTFIQDINSIDTFDIYPNPSSGIFTLKGDITQTKISIHDVLGNCVWDKEYRNEAEMKIDLSDQPKGIYFLEILSENERVVRKVVIE